jgi:hypothetical protein
MNDSVLVKVIYLYMYIYVYNVLDRIITLKTIFEGLTLGVFSR